MTKTNIRALLPEDISDEAAYHLVNFFMDLALTLESIYFAQTRRYLDDNTPIEPDHWNQKIEPTF